MITVQRLLCVGLFLSNVAVKANDNTSLITRDQMQHPPSLQFESESKTLGSKSSSSRIYVRDKRMVTLGACRVRTKKAQEHRNGLQWSSAGSLSISQPALCTSEALKGAKVVCENGELHVEHDGRKRLIERHCLSGNLRGIDSEKLAAALTHGLNLDLRKSSNGEFGLHERVRGEGGGPIGAFLCGGFVMAVGYIPMLISLGRRRRVDNMTEYAIANGDPKLNALIYYQSTDVNHGHGTHAWAHAVHSAATAAFNWGMACLPF